MPPDWNDTWEQEDFANAYRNWMQERMQAEGYDILFDVLHDIPFEWDERNIPRDSDRADDGRYLRLRFSEESNMRIFDGELAYPCSFLEFLIALAFEIEDNIMYDSSKPNQEVEWFWEIMSNLGLAKFTDERMHRESSLAYATVNEIADMVMKRRYDYNGYPGMFPLRKPQMDQTKVEIWYQANAYFIEKYFE